MIDFNDPNWATSEWFKNLVDNRHTYVAETPEQQVFMEILDQACARVDAGDE